MNHNDFATLQRLIVELDDTHKLYSNLGGMLVHPHVKYLLERVLLSHAAIAEDLVEHMRTLSAPTARGGSLLGGLRARYIAWLTATCIDVELGCMTEIERHEVLLAQHFAVAAEHTPGLKRRLYRHLHELDRNDQQIELLMREIATSTLTVVRIPVMAPLHSSHDRTRR